MSPPEPNNGATTACADAPHGDGQASPPEISVP